MFLFWGEEFSFASETYMIHGTRENSNTLVINHCYSIDWQLQILVLNVRKYFQIFVCRKQRKDRKYNILRLKDVLFFFSSFHFHFVLLKALLKSSSFYLQHSCSTRIVFVFPSSNSARCIQFTCFELAYLIIISAPFKC